MSEAHDLVAFHPSRFPARPPSEVEWEDLLVRLDVVPRAVGVVVADAGEGTPALRDWLTRLIGREVWLADALEALRTGGGVSSNFGIGDVRGEDGGEMTLRGFTDAFTRLRGRSFAAVQRRGLEVWDWRASDETGGEVTAYQLLSSVARTDGWMLARLREAAAEGAGA